MSQDGSMFHYGVCPHTSHSKAGGEERSGGQFLYPPSSLISTHGEETFSRSYLANTFFCCNFQSWIRYTCQEAWLLKCSRKVHTYVGGQARRRWLGMALGRPPRTKSSSYKAPGIGNEYDGPEVKFEECK